MYTIILSLNCRFIDRLTINDYKTAIAYVDSIVTMPYANCDTAEVYKDNHCIYTKTK